MSTRWTAFHRPPEGARLRLFCFPFAGGGASAYRGWQAAMPAGVEVVPVQLPGREGRFGEPLHRSLHTLLPPMLLGLRGMMELPFAFFGHSMGALVAFELARLLARVGAAGPVRLFASAYAGPRVLPRHPQLHALPAAEFMEEMRTLNGTPAEVLESREIMDALFPVLRADFEMCETYRYLPGDPLPCPLHVLGGADDPNITRDDLEAWAAETSGTFDLRIFPGDHFYLQSSPAAPLAAVRALLEHELMARALSPGYSI